MENQREWTNTEILEMTVFLSKKLKEEKDAGVKGKYTKMIEVAEARRIASESSMTHEHIIEPKKVEQPISATEQVMIEIGRTIQGRMKELKMSKYMVRKRINEIRRRNGKGRVGVVGPTSLDNLLEGRGVNISTLLTVLEAVDMDLPMPRPAKMKSLEDYQQST